MKLIIEQKDVDKVRSELLTYSHICLTNNQARKLIKTNPALASELYSSNDSLNREILHKSLCDWLLDGKMHWPGHGDTEMYSKFFYASFKESALKKGVTLGDFWNDK